MPCPTFKNQLNGGFFGDYEIGVEAEKVHQPAARHGCQKNSYDATDKHNALFLIFMAETNCA